MPPAAAPYRASGLVLWRRSYRTGMCAPTVAIGGNPDTTPTAPIGREWPISDNSLIYVNTNAAALCGFALGPEADIDGLRRNCFTVGDAKSCFQRTPYVKLYYVFFEMAASCRVHVPDFPSRECLTLAVKMH